MTHTKLFSLEGKGLKLNTAADILPHIQALKENPDVEEIRLNGNTLGIEACQALAGVLQTKKKLKVAELADIFTGRLREEIPPALSALLHALLTCPHLHTVDLSDNAFGLLTEAPLIEFFSRHGPLQHLILANNGLGPQCGASIAKALQKLAVLKASDPKYPSLETVICGRNRLENGSMGAWAEAFSMNNKVKTVKMVQNGIRPEGIEKLIREGLAKCKLLETLDLQDNTFTQKGATALSKAVVGWSNLLELGVGDCLLSARGGTALAEALQAGRNKHLKRLKLQYNEIDVKGVKQFKIAISDALPALERIELNGNKFPEDDEMVIAIREIFEERGVGEIDGLSDMEEESEEEEEEEEEEEKEEKGEGEEEEEEEEEKEEKGEGEEEEREKLVKGDKKAEMENVAPTRDKEVDELAELLSREVAV